MHYHEVLNVITHTRRHRNTKAIFSVVLSACYCAVHPLSLCSSCDELWLVGRWATAGDSLLGPHCKTVGLWIRTSHTLTGRWAHYKLISCCSLPARWYSPFVYSILSFLSSLPSNFSLPSTFSPFLPLFCFSLFPLSHPPSLRSWPRAHPCLYAPHTATGGHLLTRHHLQASVAWCRCTVFKKDVMVCIYTHITYMYMYTINYCIMYELDWFFCTQSASWNVSWLSVTVSYSHFCHA